MSVWKSDEKLFIFASLISPSKIILFERWYQPFDTVFHHQMKRLEVRKKFSVASRIFNSLLVVSSGNETLRLMLEASNLPVAFHQSYDESSSLWKQPASAPGNVAQNVPSGEEQGAERPLSPAINPEKET